MQRTGFHRMSMQAVADEANVSVGLIYKYFDGKEAILLAAVVSVLEVVRDQLHDALKSVSEDPVERFAAVFKRYCEIVDSNLDAVALIYRESRTLDRAGSARINSLEIETSAPLRSAIQAGIAAGAMNCVDIDLIVGDASMLAHGWALKHWQFGLLYTVDSYANAQSRLLLRSLLTAPAQRAYKHLME